MIKISSDISTNIEKSYLNYLIDIINLKKTSNYQTLSLEILISKLETVYNLLKGF